MEGQYVAGGVPGERKQLEVELNHLAWPSLRLCALQELAAERWNALLQARKAI